MRKPLRRSLPSLLSMLLTMSGTQTAHAQDEHFDIQRFEVVGNTLLSVAQIRALLDPIAGKQRVYGDVQKGLEALEGAYRAAGYGTVQVEVPEQELTSGVVQLKVVEVKVGKITVSGNKFFDEKNIQAGLLALKLDRTPNLKLLSEQVQLSNENPAKKVEVIMGVGETDDTVDLKINVTDNSPHRVSVSLDNTGAPSSGQWRSGLSYQYANLFNRDHTASIAYTTSPDSPKGVKVNQFSLGYRLPLYALGDSIDLIFGKSSSTTPSSTPNLGGALNIVGKGDVAGLRFNHTFPRQGETTSKLVGALDYKFIDSRCSTVDGTRVPYTGPTPPIAACVPFTVMPLSATYSVSTKSAGAQIDGSFGLYVNVATGEKYTNVNGRIDRYSYLTPGNRNTQDNFVVVRGGGSYLKGWQNDLQMRVALTGQFVATPIIAAEQFGLAGSNAVRGFAERAVAADGGVLLVSELYSPDVAVKMGWAANARFILFYDAAYGFNQSPSATMFKNVSIASLGFGLRAGIGKDVSLRGDVARIMNPGTAPADKRGDVRAHVSLNIGF